MNNPLRHSRTAAGIAGGAAAVAVLVPLLTGGSANAVGLDEHTVLAFRTPVGAVSIPTGTTRNLGVVRTAPYETIRIVADERVGSRSNVTVTLTILQGSELVGPLTSFTLSPHSSRTFTVPVPATAVSVTATAAPSLFRGSDAVDVLVYGN
jgi:hypothetical protein